MDIAVIVSHFNQELDLSRCLTSLAMQTYQPAAVIVVDDCSQKKMCRRGLERYVQNLMLINTLRPSGGPALPRNEGINHNPFQYSVFVDADDALLPHTLESLKRIWEKDPEAIGCGDMIAWKELGQGGRIQKSKLFDIRTGTPSQDLYAQLRLRGNDIVFSGSGGPTTTFKRYPFDSNQQWEDFDLWLRLAKDGHDFYHTGQIHTLYQLKENSRSGSAHARRQGCRDIRRKHYQDRRAWQMPLWWLKQRWL